MKQLLKYISNSGKVLLFNDDPSLTAMEGTDLRDYEWTAINSNNPAIGLKRSVTKRSIPVAVICDSVEEATKVKNNLTDVFESDVLQNTPGCLWVGEWYLKCFITASLKSNYMNGNIKLDLKVMPITGMWIREHVFQAGTIENSESDYPFLDHPYDFPYDFSVPSGTRLIENPSAIASDFRMIIYGPIDEPRVWIGGQPYHVACEIEAGEYLAIDSTAATIILFRNLGEQIDMFAKRDKPPDGDTLAKILPGKNNIIYSGSFRFDLTLFEERSEPTW